VPGETVEDPPLQSSGLANSVTRRRGPNRLFGNMTCGTFDRQQAKLSGNAAVCRETAEAARGGQHSMAGNDDCKWILSERLPNRTSRFR